MKNLKKEINAKLMGDKAKIDLLAELSTQSLVDVNRRVDDLQNAVSLMQHALLQIERNLNNIELYLESLKKEEVNGQGTNQETN